MSLDDIVQLTITAATSAPSRASFGTPGLAVYHSVTPNLVDEFNSLKAMTDAGFATTSPAYRMATKAFSQNPRPAKVKILKRTRAYTQTVELTPVNVTEGYTYLFKVVSPAGVVTEIEYTVPGSATVASVVTALTALIDPVTDVTATDGATKITVACAVGKLFNLVDLPNPRDLKVKDVTADPGIAADLADVAAIDATGWYGLCLDQGGEATIGAAAAWIEAQRKVAIFSSTDSAIVDNAITIDVASDLKAAAYARSGVTFSQPELLSYQDVAWMSALFPFDPGSATWAYKTLRGVTVSNITGGQASNAIAKNCNVYTNVAGVNVTQPGKTGSGEWIDVTTFIDWLYARIQERVFTALINVKKIPFTDLGVDIIRNEILAVLKAGINIGGLAADPAPTVTAPLVKNVDPADKIARLLPNVTFTGTLAGAIHAVKIEGTLSV